MFRKHFNATTVVAVVALVFAMAGGAYAAKKYLITSTKQISPSVLKALKGAAGAQGSAGPQGPAGANGKDGTNGAPGEKGAAGAGGKSVEVAKINTGVSTCSKLGGAEVKQEGSATGVTVCNGQTGFTTTLPTGKTETGEWGIQQSEPSAGYYLIGTAVSFNIPLSEAPEAHMILPDGEEATSTGEQKSTVCLGKYTEPSATNGNLCVYTSGEAEAVEGMSKNEPLNKLHLKTKWAFDVGDWPDHSAAGTQPNTDTAYGFGVQALGEGESLIKIGGTWAVTAK